MLLGPLFRVCVMSLAGEKKEFASVVSQINLFPKRDVNCKCLCFVLKATVTFLWVLMQSRGRWVFTLCSGMVIFSFMMNAVGSAIYSLLSGKLEDPWDQS